MTHADKLRRALRAYDLAGPETPERTDAVAAVLSAAHRVCDTTPEPEAPWVACADRMPAPEEKVLIVVNGALRMGALFWEYPGHEDTYKAFTYWDDPEDDGQPWEHIDVTHWVPLPTLPAQRSTGHDQ